MRILLIDDEDTLVAGLEAARTASLVPEVGFELERVRDVKGAYPLLRGATADVVAISLKPPLLDGVAFLKDLSACWPYAVRIALSTEGQSALVLRSMGLAHRVLAKPLPASHVVAAAAEAAALRTRIYGEQVLSAIAGVTNLPSPPRVYQEVQEAVQDESSLKEIGSIVASDPAITSKLLQVANSSLFSGRRAVTSAEQAVVVLGVENLKTLLLTTALRETVRVKSREAQLRLDSIWNHCTRVGVLARTIASAAGQPRAFQEECFSAGILHELGRIVMISCLPSHESEIVRLTQVERMPLAAAERAVVRVSHAELGAHLLSLWGLPDDIVDVVCTHEDDFTAAPDSVPLKKAVVAAADSVAEIEEGSPDGSRRLAALGGVLRARGIADAILEVTPPQGALSSKAKSPRR